MATPVQAGDQLDIAVSGGLIRGVALGSLQAWLGIPYAAPPVGALRWRPPQAPAPWKAVREADAIASGCAQNEDLGQFARAGGTEDCLYLNVYRPAAAKANRPVFVWIHGGGLKVGQGADYDPEKLVAAGSIVVTINYRLGLFGFFAHPELNWGHPLANYGILDQQAALRWVQRNIRAFGGDPRNVTIAGESAGGASVMTHIASPFSKGLFRYAISMSGAGVMLRDPALASPRPLRAMQDLGVGFAARTGCARDGGAIACLRALSTRDVLAAQQGFTTNQVIIDGMVLPAHPSDLFRARRVNAVTLIAGNTLDEGRFFAALFERRSKQPITNSTYADALTTWYGADLAPSVMREYPLSAYDSPSAAYSAAFTAGVFACPGLAMNRLLSGSMPVYAYEFTDRTAPSYINPASFPLLAAHTFELPYLFRGFRGGTGTAVPLDARQEALSAAMVGVFTRPDRITARASQWTRFDRRQRNVMSLGLDGLRMTSKPSADVHHCAFWDKTGLY